MSYQQLIITAASEGYALSLFALIGSLNCNWPEHPPVLIYDLGLSQKSLETLHEHQIPVRKIPPFCSHWRKHYTWKLWCWQDAPADHILWMDAGMTVLAPLPEVFIAIQKLGYFTVPTDLPLVDYSHAEACQCCGVPPDFRHGKVLLAANFVGMDKTGHMAGLIGEAYRIALDEKCIASSEKGFNTDQAIFNLLMYKYFDTLILASGPTYAGWLSPRQIAGQKVWAHRRNLVPEDASFFAQYLAGPGPSYFPHLPRDGLRWFLKHPGHIWRKIQEKGLGHALHWGCRIVMGGLSFTREDPDKVSKGLRD
jgi:hypothetical protein